MTGSHRTQCPQHELAVGWAVHSLEPREEAQFADHLPHCAECAAQVRATEDVAAVLGRGVVQVDPPARLREAVLVAARATPPAGRSGSVRVQEVPRSVVAPSAPAPVSRFRRVLVAAAAVGVLAFGAGWLGSSLGQSAPATQAMASNGYAQEAVLRDVESSRPVAVVLAGESSSSVVPVDMAAAPEGRTYWLWGTGHGEPVPLGAVVVDGSGAATVQADAVVPGFTGFAVSSEPGGATPTSPTTLVAAGDVMA